jgi:ABC-type enterochelin transport system permease subunit
MLPHQYFDSPGPLTGQNSTFPLWLLGLAVVSLTANFIGAWFNKPWLRHVATLIMGIYLIGGLWTLLERLWTFGETLFNQSM